MGNRLIVGVMCMYAVLVSGCSEEAQLLPVEERVSVSAEKLQITCPGGAYTDDLAGCNIPYNKFGEADGLHDFCDELTWAYPGNGYEGMKGIGVECPTCVIADNCGVWLSQMANGDIIETACCFHW